MAIDIGNWMGALETLNHVSVVTNTFLLYFTHRSYRSLFVESNKQEDSTTDLQVDNVGWELAQFLLFLMITEHLIIAIKFLISINKSGTPAFVAHGLMERKKIINKFVTGLNKEKKKNPKNPLGPSNPG